MGSIAEVDTSTKEEAIVTGGAEEGPSEGGGGHGDDRMCSEITITNSVESNSNDNCFSN